MGLPRLHPYELFDAIRQRQIEQIERERQAMDRFTWVRDRAHELTTTEAGLHDLIYSHEMHLDTEFLAALLEISKSNNSAYRLITHIDNRAREIAENEYDDNH